MARKVQSRATFQHFGHTIRISGCVGMWYWRVHALKLASGTVSFPTVGAAVENAENAIDEKMAPANP
jgi:hypothetical protein